MELNYINANKKTSIFGRVGTNWIDIEIIGVKKGSTAQDWRAHGVKTQN